MSDTTDKPRLFLSYARADDEPFVQKLHRDLQRVGFEPWYDRENMTNDGAPFTQAIADGIRASQRFLLIVGPKSVASKYCRGEWELALKLCIPVIPLLRLDDYPIIPAEIGKGHAIDCRDDDDYNKRFDELHRILRDPLRPLTVITTVPRLPEHYVPRPKYLDPLKTALRSGDPLLVLTSRQDVTALVGMGGIGKTTLASALCHDCEVRRTFDQILWVEGGPERTVDNAPSLMRAVVGGQPDHYTDLNSARTSFARMLENRKTLIVLDDVWDNNLVKAFEFAGVDCRLLLTTRQKRIVDNVSAHPQTVDKLDSTEAQALLTANAQRPLDPADMLAVINRLDGHALAVTLAGRWLAKNRLKTGADLLARLDKRPDFRDLKLDERDKNLNLELALRLSYDDLDADAQRHFRVLGVLAPAALIDLEGLQAVWGIDDEVDAEDALRVLLDAGLLDEETDTGEALYSQHGLLHTYARALLAEAGELDATFARYADFVIDEARQFIILKPEDWGQLDPLLPHVDFVGAELVRLWDATENPDEALKQRAENFAYNVKNYVHRRPQAVNTANGTVLRGLDWLVAGLAATRQTSNQKREALFLNRIALAWSALGEKRKALEYHEQALPLRRLVDDRGGEATTLNNIGEVWRHLGDNHKALEYFQHALPLRQVVGDRRGEAVTLNNIGAAWSALGEKQKALDYYEQALLLRRAVSDRRGEAATLNNIGEVWRHLGDNHKALEYHSQSLPLRRAMGDRRGEAVTLNNIGRVWADLGEKQKALDYYEQALPLRRAVGDRRGEAITLRNIGRVYESLGDLDQAIAYFERCVALEEQIGHPDLESDLQELARLKRLHDGDV